MKRESWPPLLLRPTGDRKLGDELREREEDYAQRRANETGRAYIISNIGHVLMDCQINRMSLRALRAHVVRRIEPTVSPLGEEKHHEP